MAINITDVKAFAAAAIEIHKAYDAKCAEIAAQHNRGEITAAERNARLDEAYQARETAITEAASR